MHDTLPLILFAIDIGFAPEHPFLIIVVFHFENFITPPIEQTKIVFRVIFDVQYSEKIINIIAVGRYGVVDEERIIVGNSSYCNKRPGNKIFAGNLTVGYISLELKLTKTFKII